MRRRLVLVLWWIMLFPTLVGAAPDDVLKDRELQVSKLQAAFRSGNSIRQAMLWVRRTSDGKETPRLRSEFFIEGERLGFMVQRPKGELEAFGATNGDLLRIVRTAAGTAVTVPGVIRLRADQRVWNHARRKLTDLLGVRIPRPDALRPHLALGPSTMTGGVSEFTGEISVNTGTLEATWLQSDDLLAAERIVESVDGNSLTFEWSDGGRLDLDVKTGLPIEWAVYDGSADAWIIGRRIQAAWAPERWRAEIDRFCSAPGLVPDYSTTNRTETIGTLGALVKEIEQACDDLRERPALHPRIAEIMVSALLDEGPRQAEIRSSVSEASRRLAKFGGAPGAGQNPCTKRELSAWIVDTLMDEWSWRIKDAVASLGTSLDGCVPTAVPFEAALYRALRLALGRRVESAWESLQSRPTAR